MPMTLELCWALMVLKGLTDFTSSLDQLSANQLQTIDDDVLSAIDSVLLAPSQPVTSCLDDTLLTNPIPPMFIQPVSSESTAPDKPVLSQPVNSDFRFSKAEPNVMLVKHSYARVDLM